MYFLYQEKGVTRVAVGIGKRIKQHELVRMSGSKERAVSVKHFNALTKYLDKIRELSCGEFSVTYSTIKDPGYSFPQFNPTFVWQSTLKKLLCLSLSLPCFSARSIFLFSMLHDDQTSMTRLPLVDVASQT